MKLRNVYFLLSGKSKSSCADSGLPFLWLQEKCISTDFLKKFFKWNICSVDLYQFYKAQKAIIFDALKFLLAIVLFCFWK